jgi:MFS family permease
MIGRKLLIQLNIASFIVGMIITILCVNVYMAAVGLFLSVLGISNAYIICFYFIVETISDDQRERMSVLCQSFYGVGVILDILWYWSIGNWQIILTCCFLAPAIAVLAVLTFIIKDTPKCLVLNNSSEEALLQFQYIAKINGI